MSPLESAPGWKLTALAPELDPGGSNVAGKVPARNERDSLWGKTVEEVAERSIATPTKDLFL